MEIVQPGEGLDPSEYVSSLNGLTGDVVLAAGTNISLTPVGNTITIASSGGGMSIGGTVASGTEGSVLFVGSGGVLAQDNANLFFDNSNNQLLMGDGSTTNPAYSFVNRSGTGWYLGFGQRPSLSFNGTKVYEYTGIHVFTGSVAADEYLVASTIPFVALNSPQTGMNFKGRNASTQDSGDIWIIPGTPGGTSAGSKTRIVGSVGSGTNQNGGDVHVNGGAPTGSGSYGNIFLGNIGGLVSIGSGTPTARLHLPAGTATASTAPIKLTAGTLLTTPELGTFEYSDNGTIGHLYFTLNVAGVPTRVQII